MGQPKRLQAIALLIGAAAVGAAVAAGCSALLRAPPSGGGGETRPGRPATARTATAGSGKRAGGAGPGQAASCPDLSNQTAVEETDWTKDFDVQEEDVGKLKAALGAARGVQSLSAKVEAELKGACIGITKDLGSKTDADSVESACTAAAKAIAEARARLGASARVNIVYIEPHCAIPAAAASACLARCETSAASAEGGAPPPRVECAANASSGTCEGKCAGTCDVPEGMVCDGHCRGGCDWGFRGGCDGTCLGRCNGRASRGFCKGSCSGQCLGVVLHGTCKGRCQGPCELRHAATCAGTCAGRCTSPFKALACEGPPRAATADAACNGRCDAELVAAAKCSPAWVTVTIDHSRHAQRAHALTETLQSHLPIILKIAVGMKARATGAARTAQAALQSGEDVVSSAAGRGQGGAALSSCAGAPLRDGLAAIGNLNVSVRVAIEVKTAADASDNAGGHPRG